MRTSIDDNVLTLWLDTPGKSVNVFSRTAPAEMGRAIEAIASGSLPRAVILASVKPTNFAAGADLFELAKWSPEELDRFLVEGQTLCDRIAALPMPTVAAINGHCLGGGMEMALACTHRVAVNEPKILMGLPELKVGLLPGWGGTCRMPRVAGLSRGLKLVLTAATFSPGDALKDGVVDELVEPGELLGAAKRRALSPKGRAGVAENVGLSMGDREEMETARRGALAGLGHEYPATAAVMEAVRASFENGWEAGMAAERRGLHEAHESEEGRKLLGAFIEQHHAKRRG